MPYLIYTNTKDCALPAFIDFVLLVWSHLMSKMSLLDHRSDD